MNMTIDISKNAFLQEILDQGKAEGKAEGKLETFLAQLNSKFGRIPNWANQRLVNATPAQLDRWVLKILTADTLEGEIGRRGPRDTR